MTRKDIENAYIIDIIDVRDIIARLEELEDIRDEAEGATDEIAEELAELAEIEAILADLKGNGGDEQWRGDWYPITLIHARYFEEYARQLAEDCGMVTGTEKWPLNCIDWKKAARELEMDYTSTEIVGETYYYR